MRQHHFFTTFLHRSMREISLIMGLFSMSVASAQMAPIGSLGSFFYDFSNQKDSILRAEQPFRQPFSVKNTSVLRGGAFFNCQPHTVKAPDHGVFDWTADGQFYYRPFIYFSGIDTAIVQCSSKALDTVFIEVKASNSAPKPKDTWLNALNSRHIAADLRPFVSDTDGNLDAQSFKIVESPLWGSALLMPDGQFSYEAPQGFTGIERVSYRVCDNGLPVFCRSAQLMVYVETP